MNANNPFVFTVGKIYSDENYNVKTGVFIRVGVKKNEEIIPVHSSKSDIDEESMPFYAGMMSYVMMKNLHGMEGLKKGFN